MIEFRKGYLSVRYPVKEEKSLLDLPPAPVPVAPPAPARSLDKLN